MASGYAWVGMRVIDGSLGEGGGQVLRTALALALLTREPLRITRIRARRPKAGLRHQHLAAVRAAAEVGAAEVAGAELGSQELTFWPRRVAGGVYRWDVGTAGSVSLVLQAVLPALVLALQGSRVELSGGTHNPQAPPFEFLERVLLPVLREMGAGVRVRLERYGFYPAGGGRVVVEVEPARTLRPVVLTSRGQVEGFEAVALFSRLPPHVAARELAVVRQRLGWGEEVCTAREVPSPGPGNALLLSVWGEGFAEVVTAFGRRGVAAEVVAGEAVEAMARFLAAEVPVGEHLADQLLPYMALAGAGRVRTLPLSLHARTVIEVVRAFLPVEFLVSQLPSGAEEVEVVAGEVA